MEGNGFAKLVYGTLEGNGIDTKDMPFDDAVKKFNELGGESNWKAKIMKKETEESRTKTGEYKEGNRYYNSAMLKQELNRDGYTDIQVQTTKGSNVSKVIMKDKKTGEYIEGEWDKSKGGTFSITKVSNEVEDEKYKAKESKIASTKEIKDKNTQFLNETKEKYGANDLRTILLKGMVKESKSEITQADLDKKVQEHKEKIQKANEKEVSIEKENSAIADKETSNIAKKMQISGKTSNEIKNAIAMDLGRKKSDLTKDILRQYVGWHYDINPNEFEKLSSFLGLK